MNICFPVKTYFNTKGGIESFTNSIADNLISLGHQVHIVVVDKTEETIHPKNNLYIHKFTYKGANFRGAWRIERNFPLDYLLYSWQLSEKLNKIVKKYSIDIIESSRWFETFFYLFRKSVPVVSRLHISMKKLIKDGIFPNVIRTKSIAQFELYQMLLSDGVLAVSEYLRTFFLNEFNIKKEITVVHNGIEIERFYPIYENETKNPTVLFVGRLEETKGIEFLGKAMPMVLSVFPETKFIFIGQDYGSKKLGKKFREYLNGKGNSKNILILNSIPREELLNFYRESWICVFPSLYESFPMVALEAMACGKPVIATKVGGFPELIEHNRTGILIPPKDSSAISNSIIELIKNKRLRKEIGCNAREIVELKFNMKLITNKTLEFYENTLSSSKKYLNKNK